MSETKERDAQPFDIVERPKHYNVDPSGLECVELAELTRFAPGNAIKYVWRAGLKDGNPPLLELRKAAWYIKRILEHDQLKLNHAQLYGKRKELVERVAKHRHEAIAGVLTHLIAAENMADAGERLTLHKLALLELQHYILLQEQAEK
jgi:hypothetical protein